MFLVIFLVNVVNFIIFFIVVILSVYDVYDVLILVNLLNFEVVNVFLIDFGVMSFRFKIMSFFWFKMIVDYKSIF